MRILLHVCCGPCTIYPLQLLRQEGHEVSGYFQNPNIHPFREFKKRLGGVTELSRLTGLEVDYERGYGLREFLRAVVFHEEGRCALCYRMRLEATARMAKKLGVEAFSSTLLYSRYQNHELLRQFGEQLGAQYEIPFYYRDFREGWQEGIEQSLAMELYRQSYCGCIYSEEERYDRRWRQKKAPASSRPSAANLPEANR